MFIPSKSSVFKRKLYGEVDEQGICEYSKHNPRLNIVVASSDFTSFWLSKLMFTSKGAVQSEIFFRGIVRLDLTWTSGYTYHK